MKDEFLAMLGHELRKPLAPIVTALAMIRTQQAPALNASGRSWSGRCSTWCGWSTTCWTSRGSRAESWKRERTDVDFADAIADGVETASPLLDRGITR